jgi:GH25 family lysozyme M1 (1,4-beta-N-acetylmuramidase)
VIFNDGSQYRVLDSPQAQINAGRELFAYRVASTRVGQMYVDRSFDYHRSATAKMKATLLYQFTFVTLSAEAQAGFFLATVGRALQQHEMVCLDLETGGGFTPDNVASFASRWLNIVEPALDTKAWLYVPGALASPLTGPLSADRVIWAPRYSGTAERGSAPSWRHDVHQYTDRGPFPGCAQVGDTSYTAYTSQQLLARCNPSGFNEPPH